MNYDSRVNQRTVSHVGANSDPVVRDGDLVQARHVIPSSITTSMLKQFEEFNQKRFG